MVERGYLSITSQALAWPPAFAHLQLPEEPGKEPSPQADHMGPLFPDFQPPEL
jgi:hypothetical protein